MSLTPARGTPLPRTPCAHEVRFVEVKLRDPDDPLADEALTPSKRTRLRACARAWLDANPHVLGAELAFLVAFVVAAGAVDPQDGRDVAIVRRSCRRARQRGQQAHDDDELLHDSSVGRGIRGS
jgi:Holliday junction resolvase-like predicted endonuclease